jgi:acetyl esterase/lipase
MLEVTIPHQMPRNAYRLFCSSSGGNLAAALALKAANETPPIPLVFQLLIVPATDHTASVSTYWGATRHAPWLTPDRMGWYRSMYLPDTRDRANWDASPLLAPSGLLGKAPKAWIAVAGVDILRDEGVAYGEGLRREGVQVEVEVYEGAPHAVVVMDGKLIYRLVLGRVFTCFCLVFGIGLQREFLWRCCSC